MLGLANLSNQKLSSEVAQQHRLLSTGYYSRIYDHALNSRLTRKSFLKDYAEATEKLNKLVSTPASLPFFG